MLLDIYSNSERLHEGHVDLIAAVVTLVDVVKIVFKLVWLLTLFLSLFLTGAYIILFALFGATALASLVALSRQEVSWSDHQVVVHICPYHKYFL